MLKTPWRTVRCVVEYRTQSSMGDDDFARHIQCIIDESQLRPYLRASKIWAKGFSRVVARLEAARPRKLQSVIRALDAAVARLKRV